MKKEQIIRFWKIVYFKLYDEHNDFKIDNNKYQCFRDKNGKDYECFRIFWRFYIILNYQKNRRDIMSVVYKGERWEVLSCERESHLIDLKISGIRHTIKIKNQSTGKEEFVSVTEVLFDWEN